MNQSLSISRRIFRKLRQVVMPRPEWERRVLATDREFDAAHGVDTGGLVSLKHLSIAGGDKFQAQRYVAVDPSYFDLALSNLQIDHDKFTFVDLGSGKGRALYLALQLPFRSIVGVEFTHKLHAVAESNFAHEPRVHLECGDAGEHKFVDGPLVVYLYNPFGPDLMRRVAKRLMDSYKETPRSIFVAYLNPNYGEAWTDNGFVIRAQGNMLKIYSPADLVPDSSNLNPL